MKTIRRLTLCALFALCSLYANAYDFRVKNDDGKYIYYTILSGLRVEVGYVNGIGNTYSGDLTIPEKVKHNSTNYTVFGIGGAAFISNYELTSVNIPSSVTYLDNLAFADCTGLTTITIPNSVTTIGELAFDSCTGLTSLTLGNSVKTIEYGAFRKCSSLTSINTPNSVETIGQETFCDCSSLTSVSLGNSLTTIGTYAFQSCQSMKRLCSLNPEPPACERNNVFYGVDVENCVLYVPIGSYDVYATADVWQDFLNIVELDFSAEGLYDKFLDDIDDLETMLNETWNTVNTNYPDVSNDFRTEYNSLVGDLGSLLAELMDAYRNGAIIDIMLKLMIECEEDEQKIESLLASAREAHETAAGIDSILIDGADGAQIYSLSGTRVNTPISGNVYILRYSDGTSKKVMVK